MISSNLIKNGNESELKITIDGEMYGNIFDNNC